MSKIVKPRPKNLREIYNDALPEPYDTTTNKPSLALNDRSKDLSTKGDRFKDVSIGLIDIDNSIMKYIETKIQPSIIQDGERMKVPVMYGFPERWQTIQEKGYLREHSGRMLSPIIIFKRDSLEANRSLGTKIDANNPKNFHVFEQTYTQKNQYDNFSVVTNRLPIKEYRLVVVPEYCTLKYSAIIFTNHLEQNNKLVEAFQYAANTYWGEEGRFQFRSNISSYSTSTEYSLGDDRTTRTNFEITLNGYIIPDTVNRDVSYPKKFFSKAQVVFNIETDSPEIFTAGAAGQRTARANAVSFPTPPSVNAAVIQLETLNYLNSNATIVSPNITSPSTVIFPDTSITAPPAGSNINALTKNDFLYFINTANIPASYVISITQVGNNVEAIFDTASIGYDVISNDIISIVGKFTQN
jgi:hypothetical protein